MIMKKTALTLMSVFFALATVFATGEGKLTVNKESSTVNWLGKKVTGQHGGLVSVKNGVVMVEDGVITAAKISVDMTSISVTDEMSDEYKQKLVGHLKSPDFFNVAASPTAEFNLTSFTKEATGQYTIKGDLTIKGTTLPIEFPARVKMDDSSVIVDADVVFDRSKYDIQYGSGSFFEGLGDNLIYDDVELKLHIVAAL
jgi:polyisoprenoid-binding protein YceI